MKIEINLKHKPDRNDMVIYDGKEWINVSFNQLMEKTQSVIVSLNERIVALEQEIKKIKGEE